MPLPDYSEGKGRFVSYIYQSDYLVTSASGVVDLLDYTGSGEIVDCFLREAFGVVHPEDLDRIQIYVDGLMLTDIAWSVLITRLGKGKHSMFDLVEYRQDYAYCTRIGPGLPFTTSLAIKWFKVNTATLSMWRHWLLGVY